MESVDRRPRIAVTMGDPAGIGPESIAAAWGDPRVWQVCRPLVFGHPEVMARAVASVKRTLRVVEAAAPTDVCDDPTVLPCWRCVPESAVAVPAARISSGGGDAAYQAICAAVAAVQRNDVAAMATAPLNKAALHAAGHPYPGHTELLAELAGTPRYAMMLHGPPGKQVHGPAGLNIIHATLHCSMRQALDQLSTPRIVEAIGLAREMATRLLRSAAVVRPPHVAVCALNPHAGEGGLFGEEESTLIAPAVTLAQQDGGRVSGPYPADTLIARAVAGEFDAVVAMYHDQGHIPVKLLAMHDAVNVTLGLPFVRTSVAHGTAFDRAWQGTVESHGMVAALVTAAQLVAVAP